MKVRAFIDGRGVVPCRVEDGVLICDLGKAPTVLHALVTDAPTSVRVRVLLAEPDDSSGRHTWEASFLLPQGLAARSADGPWAFYPLQRINAGVYEAAVPCPSGAVRIANAAMYVRDDLDALLCDVHGSDVRPRTLRRDGRSTVVFEAGQMSGPMHVLIAGEDAGEGASMWALDTIVRRLADPTPTLREWLGRYGVCVVPAVSPFSLEQFATGSYLTLDGDAIYGAATWADEPPPPEFACLREWIVDLINKRQLCLLHTWHTWRGAEPRTESEFIRAAGQRRLTNARCDAARVALDAIMGELPHSETRVADTIWCPGLAREYFLKTHNVVSFRTEVGTSADFGADYPRRLADAYLDRLSQWNDWNFVYDPELP